ncbi:LON peptidase substrate-binding domain-containing protein [Egicoccus sp. AB-alg2]|uniref:LON peptidase substrate-binding domain-containing protein n=1 Tax=Egicoccus sp. AB-alg2 TaxID=3242693 RepID=UPI00359D4C7A
MRTLPMFPLGTVLLPHMVLPLHVFEPRYRELMRQIMAGDREFGVVLIQRGHEVGGGDERYALGTVARVLEAEELDDGRWLVITIGTRRVRVERWLPDAPYPLAEVTELEEERATAPAVALRDTLTPRLRRVLAMQLELGQDGVPPTVELSDDPDVGCWQVAVVAPLTPLDAQRILETDAGLERMQLLDGMLVDLEESLAWQLRGDE